MKFALCGGTPAEEKETLVIFTGRGEMGKGDC